MAEREAGVPEAERIRFRIGVNLGDVIVEGEDIYGDGVNVAARLEQLAEPGGIVVSGTAFDHLRGGFGWTFASVGEQHLKNIERPVRVYRMVLGGGARPPERPALPLPDKPSLAVLPFDNLSGDPEQGYFADGIVEDITTALARVSGLFVIARNSSFAYRGKAVDVRQVGRELGVRYVLEGSVRKAGERVRITGQLIDAQSGAHLWAERFDGTLADVFELQDRVAEGVAGAIEPTLRGAEIERARRKPTASLDAYDLYLRALPHVFAPMFEGNSRGAAAARPGPRARPELRRGERAQGLVPPAVHTCTAGLATTRPSAWPASGLPAGRSPWARTIPRPSPWAVSCCRCWRTTTRLGSRQLRRALALSPSSALALGSSAGVHCFAGDYDTAIEHGQRALRLSPFDPLAYRSLIALAFAHLFTDRREAAAEYAERAIQANPGFDVPHTVLVASLVELGRLEEARRGGGPPDGELSAVPDRPATPGGVPGHGTIRGVPRRAAPGRAAGLSPSRRPSAQPAPDERPMASAPETAQDTPWWQGHGRRRLVRPSHRAWGMSQCWSGPPRASTAPGSSTAGAGSTTGPAPRTS